MPEGRFLTKAERKRRKLQTALGMIGAVALGAIGIFAAGQMIKTPPVDPETGCPAGQQAPPAHTIILLDETDRLSAAELDFARSLILTEYGWLPVGGRLTVRNITADPETAHDISVCRMRDPSSVAGIAVSADYLKAEYERLAGAEIDALMINLAQAEPQEASPILEFVAEARRRADFGSGVKVRRLVVHSDLAQHSDAFSQYGGRPIDTDSAVDAFGDDMSGIAVRLQYIRRRELARIQTGRHRLFWKTYFSRQGATDIQLNHDLLMGEPAGRQPVIYQAERRGREEIG